MLVRYLLVGAVALGLTVPAAGQTVQPQGGPAQAPKDRPAEVVLASAERVSAPAVEGPSTAVQTPAAPAKKRAARVTTCRCADQVAEASR